MQCKYPWTTTVPHPPTTTPPQPTSPWTTSETSSKNSSPSIPRTQKTDQGMAEEILIKEEPDATMLIAKGPIPEDGHDPGVPVEATSHGTLVVVGTIQGVPPIILEEAKVEEEEEAEEGEPKDVNRTTTNATTTTTIVAIRADTN